MGVIARKKPEEIDKLAAAIPVLARLIHDKDKSVCSGAIVALSRLGPAAKAPLLESLSEGSTAVEGLADLGVAVAPDLITALGSKDANTRRFAAMALGRMKDHPAGAVDPIIKLLDDPDEYVRLDAISALLLFGPMARPVMDQLVAMLTAGSRGSIPFAIRVIGPEPRHVDALINQLSAIRDERDRGEIMLALAAVEPPATEKLASALESPHVEVRQAAAGALSALGPKAKAAVPGLTRAPSDTTIGDRAAYALGNIGPDAQSAVPALIDHLKKSEWQVFADGEMHFISPVSDALGKIGPAAIPALLHGLKSPDEKTQAGCIRALSVAAKGSPAQVTSALLGLAKQSSFPRVRAEAAEALKRLQAASAPTTRPAGR